MSLISLDQSEYKSLDAKAYDREKRRLRIELLKLQEDVIKNNRKLCIIFEGRDTAGKSTAIRFFSEYFWSLGVSNQCVFDTFSGRY